MIQPSNGSQWDIRSQASLKQRGRFRDYNQVGGLLVKNQHSS
jgi:hypothetical protein